VKYWWVNQGQTHKKEYEGGYLWSPQVDSNGAFNYSYQTMTLVEPGDVVFSYAESQISAIGIAQRRAYMGPKPDFGNLGNNWNVAGWFVDVEFMVLESPFSPKNHIQSLLPYLPEKYSPLQKNGNGNQKVYLVDISYEIADALMSCSNTNLLQIKNQCAPVLDSKSDYEVRLEIAARGISENLQQEQIIMARRGQGVFRHKVRSIESKCRLTNVSDSRHLIASHIKPWRASNDLEKLDGNNGLMLSPHVDHLFDGGLISFLDSGQLLFSEEMELDVLRKWSLSEIYQVGAFNTKQCEYLKYHRENVLI
jgi:putative restriction endonuclease